MIDWTKPMFQRYEYYKVSPNTWQDTELITSVNTGTITKDISVDTLGSASFVIDGLYGEHYIRTYLVCEQNGETHKECLGTHLLQSSSTRFNGIRRTANIVAYTPIMELKEKSVPICYTIPKGTNIVPVVTNNFMANMRAPFVQTYNEIKNTDYDIVADVNDNWAGYLSTVLSQNKLAYRMDALGRVEIYEPLILDTMTPVWKYTDDNNSILYKDVNYSQDIYGVPNVLEVYISLPEGTAYTRVVNDDPNSPVSTISRGREIVKRETSPNITGIPTQKELENYAIRRMKELSTIEVEVSYSHAYCPVTVGDCVRLNYRAAGLENIKAKVISQTIELTPGCKVSEVAKFTTNLWR